MRTLILLVAVVLVLYIARYIWRQKGFTSKQISLKFILYGIAVVMLILMLTGRVPWVFAALGAALPIIARFLPLMRYVPLLRGLLSRLAKNSALNILSILKWIKCLLKTARQKASSYWMVPRLRPGKWWYPIMPPPSFSFA